MPGHHATLDRLAVIGEGEAARAVMLIQWEVEWGRGDDLRPDPWLVELLDGVVGRALAEVDFDLYNWSWSEGRVRFLIGVKVIGQKTSALNFIATNGAKRVNFVRRRKGKLLRRNKSAQAVDAEAAESAMTSLIREAMIQRHAAPERPGSTGTRILLGESVVGRWLERTRMHRARQSDTLEYSCTHTLALDQLPHMKHLEPEAYAAHWRAVAEGIDVELGAEPEAPEHRPYFGNAERVAEAMERYDVRVRGIQHASRMWRAFLRGRRPAPIRYPDGTHCPGALCRALPRALARGADPPSDSA